MVRNVGHEPGSITMFDPICTTPLSTKRCNNHRPLNRQPVLSPPPLLHDVAVVLVAPKRPVSIGTVARSLSCFECPDLRIVQPRCELLTRASRNSSKGAQYLLHNAQVYKSLEDALKGCGMAAAFARWLPAVEDEEDVMVDGVQGISALHKRQPLLQLQGVPALLQHVAAAQQQLKQQQQQQPHQLECVEDVQGLYVGCLLDASHTTQACMYPSHTAHPPLSHTHTHHTASPSLALVFGREEAGLTNEEIHACDCAVSISIGRLQESLSLSHAVSIALSQLYQVLCMWCIMLGVYCECGVFCWVCIVNVHRVGGCVVGWNVVYACMVNTLKTGCMLGQHIEDKLLITVDMHIQQMYTTYIHKYIYTHTCIHTHTYIHTQQRLDQGAHACSTITTMDVAHAYTPASRAQLAAGWREQGKER